MKKEWLLGILSAIVLFFGISYLLSSGAGEDKTFVRALDTTPEIFERKVATNKNIQFEILKEADKMYSPAQVRIDREYMYINDFSVFTIYKFNAYGKLIDSLETTRGRGPGEIKHLTDFSIQNDTIWVADSQNMRVVSFSMKTGENIHNFILEHRPMRIANLSDRLVIQWLGADSLFSTFDYEGNEITKFGSIIENQFQHQISLDGSIRSNGKDRFVYIPFYASLIYHYTSDGKLLNVLKAPDGVRFPSARRDGAVTYAPDFSFMRDGYIDHNDYLYIYTKQPKELDSDGEIGYVDKYNLRTASYVKSLRLNQHFTSFVYHPYHKKMYATDMHKAYVEQVKKDF